MPRWSGTGCSTPAKDEDSLACAIYLSARVRGKKTREAVKLFGAKASAVGLILRSLRGESPAQDEARRGGCGRRAGRERTDGRER